MDRERDKDAVEGLIEEADEKFGGGKPGRERPGQGDGASTSVDGMEPAEDDAETDTPKERERYGRI